MKGQTAAFRKVHATRIIAAAVGVCTGLFSGVNHGIFEILQGNTPARIGFIHAIGEAQRFWPLGTEDAFTLVPNFLATGILSVLVGLAAVVWSIAFLHRRHGRTVFLCLFLLSFLVGGGIGQIIFFIPGWLFATQMDKPLNGWRKILPRGSWAFLSGIWPVLLGAAVVSMLVGVEIAVFGIFPGLTDPKTLQNTTMNFILAAAVLFAASFVAGFGHDLRRMETAAPSIS